MSLRASLSLIRPNDAQKWCVRAALLHRYWALCRSRSGVLRARWLGGGAAFLIGLADA